MERVLNQAYVTLATSDSYAIGAMVLASSLRDVGTRRQLVVMITDSVSEGMKETLSHYFDHIETVHVFDSNDPVNLRLLGRPELGVTFTKLHCWRLTRYYKAVFMDADTLVLENIDDLFDRDELSAARDPGWPDNFNSGVFVFRPSLETYHALVNHAITTGSYDGGDQGLLNTFYRNWGFGDMMKHLPFIYNCCSHAFYTYLPALKQFGGQVKVVHFIGANKPWTEPRVMGPGAPSMPDFRFQWWSVFDRFVKDGLMRLEMKDTSLHSSALHSVTSPGYQQFGVFRTGDQESHDRQRAWETGQMDYTGKDRFQHIMSKLSTTIGSDSVPHSSDTAGAATNQPEASSSSKPAKR